MKKSVWTRTIIIALAVIFTMQVNCSCASLKGDELFKKAEAQQQKAYYNKARDLYKQALEEYKKTGNVEKTETARDRIFMMDKVLADYPLTYEEMKKRFLKEYKGFTAAGLDRFVKEGRVDHMIIDGRPMYFHGCIANLQYRFMDIRRRSPKHISRNRMAAREFLKMINRRPGGTKPIPQNPYVNPSRFLATMSLRIPRKDLPQKGRFRMWFPFPIQIASQRDIEIVRITPEKLWQFGPQIEGDIGAVYFEIPLEKVKKDLNFEVQFAFTHYEQRFNIDPEKVGEYDRDSPLYKKYTRSERNITVNPEITRQAKKIVGDEKNPYKKARLIYDYIMKNVKYSFMPHGYLDAMNKSESLYVHRNKYGDCGAQGMYFAALARSIGIPARCLGGYQMWSKGGSEHFWAEFYLPNYGWVPCDTTIALAGVQADDITKEQRMRIWDFFFGHLDSFRMVIQKNVDADVKPAMERIPYFKTAFQHPMAECSGMDTPPSGILDRYFKINIQRFEN